MIFISYARQNSPQCDIIYDFLTQLGLPVFRDTKNLVGADDWEAEIINHAKECKLFIFLASECSLERSLVADGMILRELEIAHARLVVDRDFRFMAIRLDECELPEWMTKKQYEKMSAEGLFEKLTVTISKLPGIVRQEIQKLSTNCFINLSPSPIEYETDNGIYSYKVPSIAIVGDYHVATEINSVIRGRISERVLRWRTVNGIEPPISDSKNEIAIDLIETHVLGDSLGLVFSEFIMGSGAPHPLHDFTVVNLTRSPWGLSEASVHWDRKTELVDLMFDELNAEDGVWGPEMLRYHLSDFDFANYVVFTEQGASLLLADYAIGPYVRGHGIHAIKNQRIVQLLKGGR